MKIKPEDIEAIRELEQCRQELLYSMALYQGHGISIREPDNDDRRNSVNMPKEVGLEVLGMLYGLVVAKLKARGVHFPEIEEGECFECDGDGKRRLRRG